MSDGNIGGGGRSIDCDVCGTAADFGEQRSSSSFADGLTLIGATVAAGTDDDCDCVAAAWARPAERLLQSAAMRQKIADRRHTAAAAEPAAMAVTGLWIADGAGGGGGGGGDAGGSVEGDPGSGQAPRTMHGPDIVNSWSEISCPCKSSLLHEDHMRRD